VLTGLTEIFGNPGSTENGLVDAIGRNDSINYVLGLQEASFMAMADGWARVQRGPPWSNFIRQSDWATGWVLYEAHRSHTPMVVPAFATKHLMGRCPLT
jgi:benzoylformate decarboxylase